MNKSKIRRIIIYLIIIIAATTVGTGAGMLYALTKNLPPITSLKYFGPSAATRVLSRDGQLLSELCVENRIPVKLDQVPQDLINALLAAEDKKFYSHLGLDLPSILRAVYYDIKAGGYVQGASTITQQVARQLFLSPEKTIHRKIKEAILALMIERRYTKEEILEIYINQAYLGSGAYGVGVAARTYFDKQVSELSLPECAMLAGLAQNPANDSPLVAPDRAKKRRDLILKLMMEDGHLDPLDYRLAAISPLGLNPKPEVRSKDYYFISHVRDILEERLGREMIYRGGLTVRTTLNQTVQDAADTAFREGFSSDSSLPGGTMSHPMKGALMVLDADSGEILALVGGQPLLNESLQLCYQFPRPAGTMFLPVIYACALERGFTQADVLTDGGRQAGRGDGSSKTLRWALTSSDTGLGTALMAKLGVVPVITLARKLGIAAYLEPGPELAQGEFTLTLMDLAALFQTMANGGVHVPPRFIIDVRDRMGTLLHAERPERQVALKPETAAIMTDMLTFRSSRDPIGESASVQGLMAGKLGLGPTKEDAWLVGYTSQLVLAGWMGWPPDSPPGQDTQAVNGLKRTFGSLVGRLNQETLGKGFIRPETVIMAPMNLFTGKWGEPDSPEVVEAAFVEGTEPPEPPLEESQEEEEPVTKE
ncbi:MAG: transglycosylase domain-containing protein [Deltaproteobacteria bacterium]|nr:transglycosylase domain-containing protein [Deltaproteobacteria bacterium]